MDNESITKLFNLHLKDQLKRSTWLPTLLVILALMLYLFSIDKGYISAPKIFTKTVKIEKEVEKEKEVVKYIEKENIKSSEFVIRINPRIDPVIANEIGKAVDKYSKEYQIPKKLILAIIRKESFFNPFARSNVAFGLMQVYPKFHKDKIKKMGIKDERELYHIDNNIHLGCWIISDYLKKENNNIEKALHDYLSKSASEKQKNEYIKDVLISYARMSLLELKWNEE